MAWLYKTLCCTTYAKIKDQTRTNVGDIYDACNFTTYTEQLHAPVLKLEIMQFYE